MPENNQIKLDTNQVLENYDSEDQSEKAQSKTPRIDPNEVLSGWEDDEQNQSEEGIKLYSDDEEMGWLDRQLQSFYRVGAGAVTDVADETLNTIDYAGDRLIKTGTLGLLPDDFYDSLDKNRAEIPKVAEPKEETGQLSRDFSKFLLGFMGGTKGLKGASKLTKPGSKVNKITSNEGVQDVAGGAAGTGTVSESDDESSTQVLESMTGIPMPDALAVDEEDSRGMRKLKMAADDLVFSGALSAGGRMFKAFTKTPEEYADEVAQSTKGAPGEEMAPKQATEMAGEGPSFTRPNNAGNINLRNINSTDEIKNLIKEQSEVYKDRFKEAGRGTKSWEETQKLAENLGWSTDTLLRRRKGEAFNAEEAVAARNILSKSAQDVMDLAEQIRARGGSDNAGAELTSQFKQALYRHTAVQEQVSGMTAEAGRALNSFNIKSGTVEDRLKAMSDSAYGNMDIDEIAKGLAGYKTQAQVNSFARNVIRPRFADMGKELWFNGLLSGLSTQAVNVASNAITAGFAPVETGLAAGIGKAKQGIAKIPKSQEAFDQLPEIIGQPLKGKQYDRVYGREATSRAYGMLWGALEGMRNGTRTFFTEMPTDALTKQEVETRRAIPSVKGGTLAKRMKKAGLPDVSQIPVLGRPFREGQENVNMSQVINAVRRNQKDGPIVRGEQDLRNWKIPFTGEWNLGGQQIRTPGNLLLAGDELFKGIARKGSLYQQAYKKGRDQGLDGKKLNEFIKGFVEDPPSDVLKGALEDSRYWTFTNQPGKFTQAAMQMVKSSRIGFVFAPFVRTPGNLLRFAFERTPAGVMFKSTRDALRQGGRASDEAMSRMLTGSSIMAASAKLSYDGYMQGSPPSDPQQRSLWYQAHQPFSIRWPGSNKSYAYSRIEPLGFLMGMGADMGNIWREVEYAEAQGERTNSATEDMAFAANEALYALSENLISKTWLQGVTGITEALINENKDIRYPLGKAAGTVVPTIVNHHTKALYPQLRDAESIWETVKSRYPSGAKSLNPRVDAFGQPIEFETPAGPGDDKLDPNASTLEIIADPTYWTRLISPFYKKTNPQDKVLNEMLALRAAPKPPKQTIEGVKLNDDQYYFLSALEGRFAKNMLDRIMHTPAWDSEQMNNMPGVKKRIIQDAYSAAHKMAVGKVLQRFPQIQQKIPEKEIEQVIGDPNRYQFNRAVQRMRDPNDDQSLIEFYGTEE